jgi:endonuclease/exonuclease/phosphatase family metal-dependent hydrolase
MPIKPVHLAFLLAPCLGACGLDLFTTDKSQSPVGPFEELDAALPEPDELPVPLRVLTYNVAGLPQGVSQGNPKQHIPLISPRLNFYDMVFVQEDFAHHDALTSQVLHPYYSKPNGSRKNLGDGLTLLSWREVDEFSREAWRHCYGLLNDGADCLTPKGFTRARLTLATGVALDVYNLHMDAGRSTGDQRARAGNFAQLAEAILKHSQGAALIVAGDFNERYRNGTGTLEGLMAKTGLKDAWVEFVHGGVLPPPADLDATCGDDPNDPGCERIDKIFFRDSGAVTFELVDYRVEGAKFVDGSGRQLSDHRPVAVEFKLAFPQLEVATKPEVARKPEVAAQP